MSAFDRVSEAIRAEVGSMWRVPCILSALLLRRISGRTIPARIDRAQDTDELAPGQSQEQKRIDRIRVVGGMSEVFHALLTIIVLLGAASFLDAQNPTHRATMRD
jgi:hypothetical protein